jgi:hypothetical protein
MTHFVVLVIGDDVEGQLAPYHEFECTGINDQYVVDVDKTAEARADYEGHKDDPDYPTFRAFLEGWYGAEKICEPGQEPDRNGEHKWGWVKIDEHGEAVQYVDRTNPNKKWDWYSIGGRWSGYFLLRQEAAATAVLGRPGTFGRGYDVDARTTDQAPKREIDFEAMAARARRIANENYDKWLTKDKGRVDAAWLYDIKHTDDAQARWEACSTEAEREAWRASVTADDLETRESYVERRTRRAGITRCIVKDGVWMERGQAGWFGIFNDVMSEDEWDRRYWDLIESLPDDTTLTIVDCHI